MAVVRDKVGKVLQELVDKMLMTKPEEPVPHMMQLLEEMTGQGVPPLSRDERQELNNLRDQHEKLKQKKQSLEEEAVKRGVAEAKEKQEEHKDDASSSDSEDEAFDEVNDDLSPINHQDRVKMAQKSRQSVSAEVFGKYNMRQAYVAKVI